MRWIVLVLGLLLCGGQVSLAEDENDSTGERVLSGVLSGLLGQPPQSPDAVYTTQERERLVSLLQSGDYATSRQGEPVDLMVFGVPLTRLEHVYTARLIPPNQTSYRQDIQR